MPLAPGYGDTPLDGNELEELLPKIRGLLGDPIDKASVYDLEQAIFEQVAATLMTEVLEGAPDTGALLNDSFLRDLHRQLYGDIWSWAGVFRRHELNIGVAPEQIAVDLRTSFDTIRYRWENTADWTPREVGIATHAEAVRIHPFTDGNGRATRLLADLVLAAAQSDDWPRQQYDWDLDKVRYIALLREYDRHRDVSELAAFIPVRAID
jgi:fido (protein-threonine AMPylation protein)